MQYTNIDYRKRVFAAMNYINRNLERDLSLDEIAETASLSKFYFHRIFKAVVGETVSEFKRRLRLELAANRLMSKPTDDITAIAIDSGFSRSQNFAKTFRQQFGATAWGYRHSKIGNKDDKNGNALFSAALYDLPKGKKGKPVLSRVIEMPESTVAYFRKVGPYSIETCEQSVEGMIRWASMRENLGRGKLFAIYWDNPDVTPPEKCRFDTCVIIADGTVPRSNCRRRPLCRVPFRM